VGRKYHDRQIRVTYSTCFFQKKTLWTYLAHSAFAVYIFNVQKNKKMSSGLRKFFKKNRHKKSDIFSKFVIFVHLFNRRNYDILIL